jgi:hypothetical protein
LRYFSISLIKKSKKKFVQRLVGSLDLQSIFFSFLLYRKNIKIKEKEKKLNLFLVYFLFQKRLKKKGKNVFKKYAYLKTGYLFIM